jgi:hypothetical protein
MSFSLDLSKFTDLTEKKMTIVIKKSFIGLSSDIIKDTPVLNGRLINNWFPAVNKFSDKTTVHKGKKGAARIADAVKVGNSFELGDTITLSNNLPYAHRIEFDGWSSVKAPAGMVRINVIRWQSIVDENARSIN